MDVGFHLLTHGVMLVIRISLVLLQIDERWAVVVLAHVEKHHITTKVAHPCADRCVIRSDERQLTYPHPMAQVTRTYMTDDLDGSEEDVSTVRIALDKVSYEIDLSAANEARLREKLARFVDAATEVKNKPAPRRGSKAVAVSGTRPDREQTQAIREWARANGHKVSDRGRISAAIQAAFGAAH